MSNVPETSNEGDIAGTSFNLKEYIYRYLRYLPFVIICILISLIIAFIKIRYSTPIYNVHGSLFINKEGKSGGKNETLEDMFLFSNTVNVKNELEILQSRPLIRRVVKNLQLEITYYNKGKVRSSNIFESTPIQLEIVTLKDSLKSFSITIEADEKKFKFQNTDNHYAYGELFETSMGLFRIKRVADKDFNYFSSNIFIIAYTPANETAEAIASSINVVQTIEQATILDISLETDNISFGKAVINELMNEYGNMNVEDKRQISRATMQFIDERLDTIKVELGGVEKGLLTYREQYEAIDLSEQSKQYYTDLQENVKQLRELQVQQEVLGYLKNYLQSPANKSSLVPTNLGIQEPSLLPLINQYNTLQLQKAALEKTIGPNNQNLLSAESSLNKLRDQILETLSNVEQSYTIAANRLKPEISRSRAQIKTVPAKEKGLLDIERQQKIKQDLYLFLLQKREEAAISTAATVSNSRPLEEALASNVPIKPNKKNTYLLAFFVGLLIPIGVIALIEILNDKVTERDDVIKQTQTPIVGEIGHAGNVALIVQPTSRTVVAEQFRILRTNLQYLINKIDKPAILITSSVSGEGKSFIATNYGAVMGLTGKKTIILEFDIRKPRLLKGLNLQASKGLTNYILGNARLEEIIIPVPDFSNLSVIGCGPIPPNPSELLLDSQVGALFEELKERFDVIVVDTAPVGLVSDAFTLSAFADASLYIVRQGYTLRKQLNMIESLYQSKRLPNMGLLINDIKASGRYGGYYGYGAGYGGYGYGYGYGYGGDYFQQQKKERQSLWSRLFKRH